jgi:hypothetical protein
MARYSQFNCLFSHTQQPRVPRTQLFATDKLKPLYFTVCNANFCAYNKKSAAVQCAEVNMCAAFFEPGSPLGVFSHSETPAQQHTATTNTHRPIRSVGRHAELSLPPSLFLFPSLSLSLIERSARGALRAQRPSQPCGPSGHA